jgi:MFS family permease
VIAGTIGVISPSGNEVGPFLSIEQAALSEVISASRRTSVFAWYQLTGALATAAGSLFGGVVTALLQGSAMTAVGSRRSIVILYGVMGLVLAFLFARLSTASEARDRPEGSGRMMRLLGIGKSRAIVLRLSALMGLDAFGGGFVVQSFAAYWFYLRFGVKPATLGGIFFGANLFAGISALLASRLAARIGLVRTMVFTHLPSNILLMLVPLAPNAPLAIAALLARQTLAQMDVPTRQAYTMLVVTPAERAAAAGVTSIARSAASAAGPALAGLALQAAPLALGLPFLLAGGLKIVYDLSLLAVFRRVRPGSDR